MIPLRFFSIVIIVTLLPLKVLADLSASLILENLDVSSTQTYISGIAQGLTFANAYMVQSGLNPIMYCTPNDLTLSSELAAEAMRYSYEKYGDNHPALLVIVGMSEMFPCD